MSRPHLACGSNSLLTECLIAVAKLVKERHYGTLRHFHLLPEELAKQIVDSNARLIDYDEQRPWLELFDHGPSTRPSRGRQPQRKIRLRLTRRDDRERQCFRPDVFPFCWLDVPYSAFRRCSPRYGQKMLDEEPEAYGQKLTVHLRWLAAAEDLKAGWEAFGDEDPQTAVSFPWTHLEYGWHHEGTPVVRVAVHRAG